LVTHRDKQSTHEILNHYNLKNLFVEIVTSDNDFALKPNPESFNYLIEKYDLNKNNTVGIGDRELDVGAANNSDITSIFMNMDRIEFDHKADYIFNNYYDFYKNILMG
jgi:phosphoglycolate phosphatase-like HAD superfamily hydrolase